MTNNITLINVKNDNNNNNNVNNNNNNAGTVKNDNNNTNNVNNNNNNADDDTTNRLILESDIKKMLIKITI